MLKLLTSGSRRATLDLATVRETLAYMHSDLRHIAGLEKAAAALDVAMREIAAAETARGGGEPAAMSPRRFFPTRT